MFDCCGGMLLHQSIKQILKKFNSRKFNMASYLRLKDFLDTFESAPIIMIEFSILFSDIWKLNWDSTSRNSSSFPDVGRYVVYASMETFESVSTNLTPQNLLLVIGSFVIWVLIAFFHPSAVPCQTGPDCNTRSSTGINMSAEVECEDIMN